MSLDMSLLSSRPVVSLASKSRRTVPREAKLARMIVRSSAKDVKEWGWMGHLQISDELCGVWLEGGVPYGYDEEGY